MYHHKLGNYLLAMPLSVLLLLSVYPSLSNKVLRVCSIVSLCLPKSARVFRPMSSVSKAILCDSRILPLERSNLSVPLSSCCLCSSWSSCVGLSV